MTTNGSLIGARIEPTGGVTGPPRWEISGPAGTCTIELMDSGSWAITWDRKVNTYSMLQRALMNAYQLVTGQMRVASGEK